MRIQLLLSLLVVTLCTAKAQQGDQDIIKVGDVMPTFSIVSDDGAVFQSSALKGKVIFINFFATWCPPCQKELAEVEAVLWPTYGKHKDFVMLTLGREHTDADLKAYNEKKGFTFPLYPDRERKIFDSFAKSLIPRSYLIGKGGKVIYQSTGFNEEDFKALMQKIGAALK